MADPSRPATALLDSLEPAPDAPATSRRRRWWRLVALILGLALVLGAGGTAGAAWLYTRSVDNSIERVDAFVGVPEESRPEKVAGKALNLLIVGSDSRDPDVGGSRTDTIILAHVSASREDAQFISIPRDTWVDVPRSADGKSGGRKAKINAAFAWGGAPLLVQTVEKLTGVRVDNVMLVDFAGFKDVVDALDGVDIAVDEDFTSVHSDRTFTAGDQHMDGDTALDYARQRYQFADGDFTRMRHQQQLVKAIIERAGDRGLLTDPVRLNKFIRSTADAVTLDKQMKLFDTVWGLRGLRPDSMTFMTSPSRDTGWVGDQSVVFADEDASQSLYEAVRDDEMTDWLIANPQE
ncbi:LCP family protein [Phytohabitans sp. ZYX-F-186]|uniref:LCP family protein n=1 Tax=Phytohabitans maris TaxID=3071409 RepID=A0ABU0ZRI9_9ACTN|nr:LCP family protein [Phytohabitans sp. ZYX-F-186]MDQ7909626.1 LCP family protein [Phytohabitans sp. ZYX-F-186]